MSSPFADIYRAIRTEMMTNVTNVKQTDQDFGQLRTYDGRPSLKFPCVLVDFIGWRFSNIGEQAQIAQGQVVLTIGYAQYTRADSIATDSMLERAMEYLELEQEVVEAFHGWSPGDDFGYLVRGSATSINLPNGIRTRVVSFDLEFEDYTVERTYTKGARPPAEISTQIEDTAG